jgi:hypothetical protein
VFTAAAAFTIDAALQHTCAVFRDQAARGEITRAECDLLIDGAILLAMHIEALSQDQAATDTAVAEQFSRPRRRAQPAAAG